jgi:hypothetical protein
MNISVMVDGGCKVVGDRRLGARVKELGLSLKIG